MRLNIELKIVDNVLTLPIHYNHILHAAILNWINDKNYSDFIHDVGWRFENKVYKMYTFSRLYGKYKIDTQNKVISYIDKVEFTLASADDLFLEYILYNVINKEAVLLNAQRLELLSAAAEKIDVKDNMKIETKSPIVVYTTFETTNCSKKTYYFSPFEDDFAFYIKQNIIKKYIAYTKQNDFQGNFSIKPLPNQELKQNIVLYKDTVIKGWSGKFEISGDINLIKLAFDAGLGSKNSQGFGCIGV